MVAAERGEPRELQTDGGLVAEIRAVADQIFRPARVVAKGPGAADDDMRLYDELVEPIGAGVARIRSEVREVVWIPGDPLEHRAAMRDDPVLDVAHVFLLDRPEHQAGRVDHRPRVQTRSCSFPELGELDDLGWIEGTESAEENARGELAVVSTLLAALRDQRPERVLVHERTVAANASALPGCGSVIAVDFTGLPVARLGR